MVDIDVRVSDDRVYDQLEHISTDPFNEGKKRSVKNTYKDLYNCAGYALGLFCWYCPYDDVPSQWHAESFAQKDIDAWASTMVEYMLKDLANKIRLINAPCDIKKGEHLVAFRASAWDFHFRKLAHNGQWYEKRGCYPAIERAPAYTLDEEIWKGGYSSKIFLLAVRANLFRRETSKPLFL